jgi:hypothetical protein
MQSAESISDMGASPSPQGEGKAVPLSNLK